MIRGRAFLAMALAMIAGLLTAAPLTVGPASKSTLTATFRQAGVDVENPFTSFKGTINYDAKNVAAATALIEVEMATLDLGDPAYSAELRKKAWFDTATFPKAVFKSTAIKAVNAGRFDATGTLTVKGKVLTITVPVTVNAAGTTFDGSFAISRKAFGIGDPVWEKTVDDRITVKFHLVVGK